MILEIKNIIWLETPKGQAVAKFLIDYGAESDLMWVCFGADGEIWTWPNYKVRATNNVTLSRISPGQTRNDIEELMRDI